MFVYRQGYDHTQSCIRKATVICLVEIYLCVGEDLRPYLKDLNGSKVICVTNADFEYFKLFYCILARIWRYNGNING